MTRDLLIILILLAALEAGCTGDQVDTDTPVDPPGAGQAESSARGGDEGASAPSAASRCTDFDPLRRAFFGDLHVHTALSQDAFVFDTRTSPMDAYRFARGEPVLLPPLDEDGNGTRPVQLERPLDFAAVTDHAEYLGMVAACTRPTSPTYESEPCQIYRDEGGRKKLGVANGLGMDRMMSVFGGWESLFDKRTCGADGASCREGLKSAWEETIEAARNGSDASLSCGFTALLGYEYSYTPELTKVHRNVIFRSLEAPLPISSRDEPDVYALWRRLREECVEAGRGCDVLTIPHNSNLSNGQSFDLGYEAESPAAQVEAARLRASLEPLMEMMQIKGSMECRNGMWNVLGGNDELCNFEKFLVNFRSETGPPPDCEDGTGHGALVGRGCASRLDFMRYALIEGLREADRIGVNPIKVGAVASTDTHDGTPGAVEENLYDGASGRRLNDFRFSPGGLAAVWAEENSREALFDAMKRRETFATSGPRMRVRFFGGPDLPEELCEDPNRIALADAAGVPMGGELTIGDDSGSPAFLALALRDPGTAEQPGGLLQRIQIIKGWADSDGLFHQSVYDIAGSSKSGASVDPKTCEPRGQGFDSLCGVWRDPDFDASRRAVYYARVLENPSCRHTARFCLNTDDGEQPAACSDPDLPKEIQERAWTSPIWVTPAG
jgi:hypothetical protein